jgi:hypothetical protein
VSILNLDHIDDLQTVLVIPLLADLDEAVLRGEPVGGDVVRTDTHLRHADPRLPGRALEQSPRALDTVGA